jgi:APA family basic amino acid/polyamine antiporter
VLGAHGVVILRRTRPDLPRPFKTPWSPLVLLLGVVTCAYLMSGLPPDTWWRLGLYLTAGTVVYGIYGRTHRLARHDRGR